MLNWDTIETYEITFYWSSRDIIEKNGENFNKENILYSPIQKGLRTKYTLVHTRITLPFHA